MVKVLDKFMNKRNSNNKNEKGEKEMENKADVLNLEVFRSLEQQATMNMQMVNSMKEMFIKVQNMTDEVLHIKTDMEDTKQEVKSLHKEVMDNVYLSTAQFDEIAQLLKDATVDTVKSLYGSDLEYDLFNKAYKRVVMRFWSLLKKHCDNVSRGREIKRKDYDKAKDFAGSLGVSSYVLSFGKRGVPSL